MVRQFGVAAIFFCLATMVLLPCCSADEQEPKSTGLSFRLSAGAGYMTSTDQLRPNDGNKRVQDLGDNANRYDAVIPLANFDLRYTFAASDRQIYLGTPMHDDGPPGLTLGGVWPLENGGQIDVGAFAMPFGDAWEDPYLVDRDRNETDKDTYGAKLDYTRIGGTGFEAGYRFAYIDIDNDKIGRRFNELERDGWVHALRLGYAFQLGKGLELVPTAGFTIGDIDGDANRYLGYRLKLGLRRFHAGNLLNLSAGVGYRNYDEEHPIFDKDRNDTLFNVFGMYTRSNLFGHAPLFCSLLAGFSHRSSNIDFLEADTLISGLMLGYRF
jgi:hypothetical protein